MPPEHELLQEEKHHDAREERSEHGFRREMRECFRKQHEKCDTEERADGVTDQPWHEPLAETIVE
jgi:hypothetical protein